MADIDHEIKIAAAPDRVFAALTTAEGLRGWHTPDVTGPGTLGSEWRLGFVGRPGFVWKVTEASTGRVAWECVQGPGDAPGTTVAFEFGPTPDGRTHLTCTHAGWPGTHGNFRKCNTTWGVLLHHLQQYAETGAPDPAYG